MIGKTILVFAILSFVGNSKGLLDFKEFDVTDTFENYNILCHIGINTYIHRKLYKTTDLEPTDQAYKKVIKDKIDEIITTYFNLLRVYYITYAESNNTETIIANTMWTEYYFMLDWNSENNGSEVHWTANKVIEYIGGNDLTLSDEKTIKNYEHCRETLFSLSSPSIATKASLTKIVVYIKSEHYNDNLPVPMNYGFMLLLIKEGEIENFFDSGPVHQIIFIVNLMNQAIINTYDTIIKIYIGLERINDEMLNILKEIHLSLINATEVVYYIQVSQRQISIEVDSSSNAPKQPECQSELINMYGIYIKNLEAKLKKKLLGDDRNDLNKYQGRLVEYKENKHTIRVPLMGYYMIEPEKEKYEILINNMNENEYYGLLMELRIWIIMIQNFAKKMKLEMFGIKDDTAIEYDIDTKYNIYTENYIFHSDPHFKNLTEMKHFFEKERDKIKQYELLFTQGKIYDIYS